MTIIDNQPKNIKNTDRCIQCGVKLRRYHPHHWLCHRCWLKKQEEKGNIAALVWNERRTGR